MANNREAKRQEILAVAKNYKDESTGTINLTQLREDHKTIYDKISYYFQGMDNFLKEIDAIRSNQEAGISANKKIVRNKLAYDMLVHLREDKKMSFEEIGNQYDVSKMYMSKLFRELKELFDNEETAE